MTNGNGNGGAAALPMSAAQFAAYMERRLALEDAIEVLGRDGQRLRLRVNGAEVAADLGNFYTAYARDPSQLDTIARNFVTATLGLAPNREVSDFAMLADHIYP